MFENAFNGNILNFVVVIFSGKMSGRKQLLNHSDA